MVSQDKETVCMTRRGLVGVGAAALAGAAAAAGYGGVALADQVADGASVQASPDGEGAFFVESDDATYGTILNPQEDPCVCTTDYADLLAPLTIAGHTLKNRIVKSAAGSETQHEAGWPSDTSLAYYGEFAKGGAGMICYESSDIFGMTGMPVPGAATEVPAGDSAALAEIPAVAGAADGAPAAGEVPAGMVSLDMSNDDCIAAHAAIADYIHQYGTVLISQMYDMMMATGASSTKVAPSALETSFSNGHMQTTGEVQAEIAAFINAGERYYKAGFDGIELNASCTHYFSTYLSRYINCERTDQYSGDSIENRCRVLTEIISGIRERVGEDFIIQVLYSGVEGSVDELGANEGFTTVEEACEMAKLFEAAGASSLHVRSEAYGHHCGGFMPDAFHIDEHGETGYGNVIDYGKHFGGYVDGSHDGYGALIGVAAKIKSCVNIPVGCVGAMDARMAPDLINNAIRDGKIDFILATRSLMADPQMPNKLATGRREACAPCTHCMTCFVAPYDFGTPMYCRVNASLTRAFTDDMPEGYDPVPAAEPKAVVVVGGGAAGMEAARIAAQRGHKVTLFEKDPQLGGMLDTVQAIKGPHEKIEAHKEYLISQLDEMGVDVRCGVEAMPDDVVALDPDAVVVATGSVVSMLPVEPDAAVNVVTFDDMHSAVAAGEELPFGERVVVVGGQFEACDIARYLLKRGRRVIMLNPGSAEDFFMGAPTWPRMMGKRWLAAKGLELINEAQVQKIGPDGVTYEAPYGVTVTVPCNTVVNALPQQAVHPLADNLEMAGLPVFCVGNCYAPSTIANAVARANLVARHVEDPDWGKAGQVALAEGEVYTATAVGIGEVTVSISVADGSIADASVSTANETQGIGRDLGEQFAAQIVEKGAIDAVSGATMTSTAVADALADCLAQAGLA